jgi:hypothetical protein
MPRGIDYYLLRPGGVHSDFDECPYRAACLKLKKTDGYILSLISQKGVVVAPTIAPWCGS